MTNVKLTCCIEPNKNVLNLTNCSMNTLKRRHNKQNISLNNVSTMHEDVVELKSESRASYYSQFTLNLDASCDASCSLSARGKRLRSGNLNKRLPPLDSSQELKISNIIQVPANNKQSYQLVQAAIPILPTTANKKRLPEKIQAIGTKSQVKFNDKQTEENLKILNAQASARDCDTPVTIDILSESGRTSRFSCGDFVTPRESYAKFPNSSSKDPIFKVQLNSTATPANLIEDPILMYTNQSYTLNKSGNIKSATKHDINRRLARNSLLSATRVEDSFFNNKRASIDVSNSAESNGFFLDPSSINCRRYSDFQLNMSNSSSNNKSFLNPTYYLTNKSASSDFYDYSESEFIEEEDDEDETETNDSEESNTTDEDDDDDDEDKNEYNHLSRVMPLKAASSDFKESIESLNKYEDNIMANDRLDTINESIRETNYQSLVFKKPEPIQTIQVVESVESSDSNKKQPVENCNQVNKPQENVKITSNSEQNLIKTKTNSTTNLNAKTSNTQQAQATKKLTNDKQMNNNNAKTCLRSQSIENRNRTQATDKSTKTVNKPAPAVIPKKPLVKQNTCTNMLQKCKTSTNIAVSKKENNMQISSNPTANNRECENVINCVPNFIETSRIQKSNETTSNLSDVAKSNMTEITLINSSEVSSSQNTSVINTLVNQTQPVGVKPTLDNQKTFCNKLNKTQTTTVKCAINSKPVLKQKSLSSQTLEINSNKINLKAKPPSAKNKKPASEINLNVTETQPPSNNPPSNTENVSVTPNVTANAQAKTTKCPENIIEPQAPVIYDMFANFDHPFATNAVKSRTASANKTVSNRSLSAPRKCSASNSKPKKSTSTTRKKAKNGGKKSKNKSKKILVSKDEINIGDTKTFSLADAISEGGNAIFFVNPPSPIEDMDNESNSDLDDDGNLKIDNNNDDDDDSSSESSEISENSSNIPVLSIGDTNTVAASQNEIEIDNGDDIEINENISTNPADNKTQEEFEPENVSLIDKTRLKNLLSKVDILHEKFDIVLNASNDSKNKDKAAQEASLIKSENDQSNQPISKIEGTNDTSNYERPFVNYTQNLNQESTNKQKLNKQDYYSNSSLNINKNNNTSILEASKDSINSNSITTRPPKTNVNIRDLYTMVNSLKSKTNEGNTYEKNTQSLNSSFAKKSSLPPRPLKDKNDKSKHVYELPPVLSNKLCSLIEMTNAHNELIKNNLKVSPLGNYEALNNVHTETKEKTITRHNYNLSLDSVGSETIKSSNSASDENNSHNYEKTYRNDPANPSSSRQIFEVKDYNEFAHKWKRGMLLGKGAFGMVYQALLSTGAIIAVKQVEMEESDPVKARKEYDNIKEEVNILKELDHENIVKFMGTSLEDYIVNIFMEFIPGGTIEHLLKIYGPFDEALLKKFTYQIVQGVHYIHSNNVVHRDIKGKNIMLTQNGIIKLIDFGCAKRLKKNQSENSMKHLLKSLKGTPYWMAPEVIRETGHGSKADIWSIGCTVFEMATGQPPWHEMKPIAAIYAIGSGESEPPTLPTQFSDDARNFVQSCLSRNPDERPTAKDLLEHSFLIQIDET